MKQKLLFWVFVTLLLNSCTNGSMVKEYKYVESCEETSFGRKEIVNKDTVIIEAASDSAAYLEAFRRFCISESVYHQMLKEGHNEAYSSKPLDFSLYDSNGKDITNISFANKEALMLDIQNSVSDVSITSAKKTTKEEAATSVDSVKIKELLQYFNVKKDEFDSKGRIWYEPKSAPKYTNMNGIYIYFSADNDGINPLRFRVQYYADDWLFFKKVQFSIDGNAFDYYPSSTETDCGNGGMIWEWFDEPVAEVDKELILSLSTAKSAKMKFIGKQYYDIKVISAKQITDINRTIELYRAMGGKF